MRRKASGSGPGAGASTASDLAVNIDRDYVKLHFLDHRESILRLFETRLAEHNTGLNRWTRAHGPWRLVYFEAYDDKHSALARERFLKTGIGRRVRDELVASVQKQVADSQSG